MTKEEQFFRLGATGGCLVLIEIALLILYDVWFRK